MPIDPSHGRNIPIGSRFNQVVSRFLRQTRKRFFDQIRQGYQPDFGIFDLQRFARELTPVYAAPMRQGMQWSMTQIAKKDPRFVRIEPPALPRLATIDLSRAFTLLQPTVEPAAYSMATGFIQPFAEVTQRAVKDTIAEGLKEGLPLSKIQARLMGIKETRTIAENVEELPVFSPKRAAVIAQTETSRAMHRGQMEYGKSVGAWGMEWLASADACPICLSLNGKEVPYGTPFYVWPDAPAEYRDVLYPPGHPNCRCTAIDVFKS